MPLCSTEADVTGAEFMYVYYQNGLKVIVVVVVIIAVIIIIILLLLRSTAGRRQDLQPLLHSAARVQEYI